MDAGTGTKVTHILLLEDDKAHQELILRMFRDDPEPFRISVAGTIREARETIGREHPDLIIADWILPDGKGIEILPRRDELVTTPLIIMTSFGDEHLAVEIMKSGAIDYIVKSATTFRDMPHIARRALRDWENITERKRAEKEKWDSEKRLADIISFLPDAVVAIDNEGRVIAWNDATGQMTGVPAGQILGKGDYEYSIPFYGERRPILIDLIHREDKEIEKKYLNLRREGERISSEVYIPTLFGGKGAYLWGTASPLYDSAGNRIGAIEIIRDITDRKKAEDAVKEREASLNLAQRVAHLGSWEMDVQSGSITWSDELFHIMGHDPQSFTPQYDSLDKVVHPDDLEPMKAAVTTAIENKTPFEFLLRVVLPDGRIRTLLDQAETQYDGDGNPIRMIGTALDITEQNRVQEALRDSELRYRSVIENAAEGITVVQDGKLQYANPRLLEMTQVRPEEFTYRPFTDFIHPDDRALVFERYQLRILGEDVPPYYDFRIIGKNGKVIWVQISAVRIIWNGKPATLNFLTDITDRKQMEDTLQKSEQEFRSLAESMPQIVWVTRADGWNIYFNQQWVDYTGLSLEESYGHGWNIPFHPDDRQRAWDAWQRATQHNDTYSIECRLRRADGAYRWWLIRGVPLRNASGEILKWFGTCTDIESIKQTEEKLRESEERYRALLFGAGIGVGYWSTDGILLFLNEISLKRLNGKEGDFTGKNIRDLFGDADAEMYLERIQKAAVSPDPREYEDYISMPVGKGWYLSVYTRITGPDGTVRGIQVLSMDITERKLNEEIRTSYEARMNSAMEIGNLAWWELDLPGGAVRFDDRKAIMLGYLPSQFNHYQDFTALLHPDDYEPAMLAMRNHIEGKESRYHADYRILTAAGDYHWFRDVGGITRRHADGSPATITGIVIDITASKLAEEAIRTNETRFQALIQNSSDIIRILDRHCLIVYESASAERILGYPPDYMIGKDPFVFIHPDDIERVKTDLRGVYEKKNDGIPTEFRVRKADGEYLWVDSIGINLLDVAGVNGIVITTRSIQQRKQAEEQINKTLRQLERSEALLRKVYDILPIGLWLADKNGKIFYGNPAGIKTWGADPHVPIEKYRAFKARRLPSCKEIAPDDWALGHTILEGVTIKDEMIEIDAFDGKKKIILNYTAPLYDATGAIDGAIVVNQEITDKVKAEKALRKNQARLSTAMDIAGLVNWEYDVASGMFTFDDRFYAFLETTADREGGNLMSAETYMQEFVYPDDRPAVLAAIQKLVAATDPAYSGQMEHRITPRDGSVRTIISRFAPIMGPDGKVIRTYGANQDITDFKLMESEIRSLNTVLEQRVKDRTEALVETNDKLEEENAQRLEAERMLQASYDEKVMLLKEIHHRVKNNLQIIASLLNLQSRYIKDEPTLAAIRESQNRVKAMALVHEKLYRSEDISHISLHEYIKFLGTGLFHFYDAKLRGIQFNLDIHDIEVDIDTAIPLGLIINELISNSLKYAFPEGKTGEVAISVSKEGRTLTVLFRDTGIGIPADLDWRNTPSLGLRLVITLIDQMNGTVELDRSAGTLFTMIVHEKEPRSEK